MVFLARAAVADFALYTEDFNKNAILKLNAQGQATLFASNGANGFLNGPEGLALDNLGNLYVACYHGGNVIVKYGPQGNSNVFGAATSGNGPLGLAMDVSNNLYLAQSVPANVLKFTNQQAPSSIFVSLFSLGAGPFGMAFDSGGNLFVSDNYRGHIYKVDRQTNVSLFATLPSAPTPNPEGLAFDSAGNLYVALYNAGKVMRYDTNANGTTFATLPYPNNGPCGLAFDSSNNLYVASTAGPVIYKYDPHTNMTVFASAASGLTGTGFIVIQETRYQNNWFKVAGGGGASTNAEFRLIGTAGQQDAAAMAGVGFNLAGGYWTALSVVQTPGAPLLTIRETASNTAVISWPSPSTGFNLQQNSDLTTTNWVTPSESVTDNGTVKYIMVNPPTGNLFFRLKQ